MRFIAWLQHYCYTKPLYIIIIFHLKLLFVIYLRCNYLTILQQHKLAFISGGREGVKNFLKSFLSKPFLWHPLISADHPIAHNWRPSRQNKKKVQKLNKKLSLHQYSAKSLRRSSPHFAYYFLPLPYTPIFMIYGIPSTFMTNGQKFIVLGCKERKILLFSFFLILKKAYILLSNLRGFVKRHSLTYSLTHSYSLTLYRVALIGHQGLSRPPNCFLVHFTNTIYLSHRKQEAGGTVFKRRTVGQQHTSIKDHTKYELFAKQLTIT